MSNSKHALLRLLTLDKCLKNPYRKYFWEDLAETCSQAINELYGKGASNVSRRTIYSDMRFLKSNLTYNAPIISIRENKRKYYRYKDLNFSIQNFPLSQREIEMLNEAVKILSSISGRIEFEFLDTVIPKLISKSEDYKYQKIISYDENLYLKNRKWVSYLFNSIREQKVLNIAYKPFDSIASLKIELHPYFLKEYNSRWFLFGYSKTFSEKGIHPLNLAIDRILSIQKADIIFQKNEKINFEEFFDDIIGVTNYRDNESCVIELSISKEAAPYIETKPLHHSQHLLQKRGSNYVTKITVRPNEELFSLLASFGKDIEVLKPQNIKTKWLKKLGRL